jgi:hypothetical protein
VSDRSRFETVMPVWSAARMRDGGLLVVLILVILIEIAGAWFGTTGKRARG